MSTTGSAHVPNGRDVLNGTTEPKITLYTNHGCGWSHRVNIVLLELGLRCDVVLIDMDVPRPEWFLKMNPVSLISIEKGGERGTGDSGAASRCDFCSPVFRILDNTI